MIASRRHGAVVRSFFALALPEPVRAACAGRVRELQGRPQGDAVRWVRPEGYHLTLRFLGNVETQRLSELVKGVAEALSESSPFDAVLGEPVAFPERRPRVVALEAQPTEALAGLALCVEEGVVAIGLPPEKRRFKAHLTLGRVRNRRIPSLEGVGAPQPGGFPVQEVVLYRSDLQRDGARYTVLERIALSP